MSATILPEAGFEADRILTEQGRWIHVNRPVDAPKASMFGGGQIIPDFGPTLRDQFAMAALTGLCGHADISMDAIFCDVESRSRTAVAAYGIADAMFAERERAK